MAEFGPPVSSRIYQGEMLYKCCASDNATLENHRDHFIETYDFTESQCTDDENYDIYCRVRADVGSDWEGILDQQCGLDFERSQQDLKAIIFADENLHEQITRDCGLIKKISTSSTSPEVKTGTEHAGRNTTDFSSRGPGTNEENPIIQRGFDIHVGWVKTTSPPSSLGNHSIAPDISQWARSTAICASFRRHLNLNNDKLRQAACINCALDHVDFTGFRFPHGADEMSTPLSPRNVAKRSKLGPTKLREVQTFNESSPDTNKYSGNVGTQSNGRRLSLGYYSRTNTREISGPSIVGSTKRLCANGKKLMWSNCRQRKVSFLAKNSKIPQQIIHPHGATMRTYRPTFRSSQSTCAFSTNTTMTSPSKDNEIEHLGCSIPKPSSIGTLKIASHGSLLADRHILRGNLRSASPQSIDDVPISRTSNKYLQPTLITQDVFSQFGSLDPMSFLFHLTDQLEVFNKHMATQLDEARTTQKATPSNLPGI